MNIERFGNNINENKSYNRIAILGGRFSGKKTILNRFFLNEGEIYSTNYSLIKKFEYFLVEKPLWEQYSERYDAMNDYFIENCSIIIYVVRTYTYEEQIKIQNLLQKFKDINKKIIVIHNIFGGGFYTLKELENFQNKYDKILNKKKIQEYNTSNLLEILIEKNERVFHIFMMDETSEERIQYNNVIFTYIIFPFLLSNPFLIEYKYFVPTTIDYFIPKYQIIKEKEQVKIKLFLSGIIENLECNVKNKDNKFFLIKISGNKKISHNMTQRNIVKKIQEGKFYLEINSPYHELALTNLFPINKENKNGFLIFTFECLNFD